MKALVRMSRVRARSCHEIASGFAAMILPVYGLRPTFLTGVEATPSK
jgi:hypothetical protein